MSRAAAPRTGLAATAVFLLSLAWFAIFLDYGINLDDEGTLLYQFARMGWGERPYEDFHAGYTPGVYYLHALLQSEFAQSILPGRLCLAVVNALTAAMTCVLVAPLAGARVGAAAALTLVSLMPLHPAHFAVFNIPYPSWYAVASFLAGLFPARRFLMTQSLPSAWLAGATAGVAFLFKPNVGAFQLACAMLLVLAAVPRTVLPGRQWQSVWWWAVWSAVLIALLGVFGFVPGAAELVHLLLPALACGIVTVRLAGQVPHGRNPRLVAHATLSVVGGFALVTAAWLGPLVVRMPAADVLEKVLFIGSDFAPFFYLPHPFALLGAALLAGFYLAGSEGALRLAERFSGRPTVPVAVAATALAAAIAVVATRPMVQGFAVSAMSALETVWCYRIAIAVHWLLLAMIWSAAGAPRGGDRRAADPFVVATLTVLGFGAIFLYLQIYPRTDFTHWVWAAPLSVAGAAYLLTRLARTWSDAAGARWRSAIAALAWAPAVLIIGMRGAAAWSAVALPGAEGTIELHAQRAPVRIAIGRAEQYRDLDTVLDVLGDVSSDGEKVAGFPVVDAVLFLAGRPTPLTDSYFFPRWLGRDDEAAAVALLQKDRPRYAVVLREHRPFFDTAPAYYQLLSDHYERNYRLYFRAGRYDVLARNDADVPAPPLPAVAREESDPRLTAFLAARLDGLAGASKAEALRAISDQRVEGYYPQLVAMLGDSSQDVRAAAVHALGDAGEDRSAEALARAALAGALPPRERTLALRLAGAWAGPRTMQVMLPVTEHDDAEIADAARTVLGSFAGRHWKQSFWFLDDAAAQWTFEERQREKIRTWLRDPAADMRLKLFAAVTAGPAGAVDDLLDVLGARCASRTAHAAATHPHDPCLLPAHADLVGFAPTPLLRAVLLASVARSERRQANGPRPIGASVAYALALRLCGEDDIYGPAMARLFLRTDSAAADTLASALAAGPDPAQRLALEYLASIVTREEEPRRKAAPAKGAATAAPAPKPAPKAAR